MSIAVNASALVKEEKTGVEWYSFQLLKTLNTVWKESDPEVTLFLPGKKQKSLTEMFERNNCKLDFGGHGPFWTQRVLRKKLKAENFKVLFSPSYLAPLYLNQKIRTLNVVHGLEGEYFPESQTVGQIISEKLLFLPNLKKSSRIIAVSDHTRADLIKFYQIDPKLIRVIKSGPGSFSDEETNSIFLKSPISKSEKKIDFVFVGGSFARKNLGLTIEIFNLLSEKTNIPTRLFVLGKIKQKEIDKLNQSQNSKIQFLGHVNEKQKKGLLFSSHFLLYPSFYEGFGFPLLEAQVNSVIPIVLQSKNFQEIGGNSLVSLIDPKSEKLNIEGILDLVKNPEKRNSLVRSGHANAKKYSWTKCAEEMRRELVGLHDEG